MYTSELQYRKVGITHLTCDYYDQIPFDKMQNTAKLVYDTFMKIHVTFLMYFLPKVHKPPPENSTFHARPIISGTNGPSSENLNVLRLLKKP